MRVGALRPIEEAVRVRRAELEDGRIVGERGELRQPRHGFAQAQRSPAAHVARFRLAETSEGTMAATFN